MTLKRHGAFEICGRCFGGVSPLGMELGSWLLGWREKSRTATVNVAVVVLLYHGKTCVLERVLGRRRSYRMT